MSDFNLDPKLEKDSIFIKNLNLCTLRLINNSYVPWFLLIPRRYNIKEIFDLKKQDQAVLMQEIDTISQLIKDIYNADKINIASLGNIVSQMHWHIIARFENDCCWPNPVWGNLKEKHYDNSQIQKIISDITDNLD